MLLDADLKIPDGAKWAPTSYTSSEAIYSKGPAVAAFAEIFLQAIDGNRAGDPIVLTEWQKWLLNNLLQTDENNVLKLREALILLPRKNGKTFLIALTMLFMLVTAPDYSQMYSVALNRKQAEVVFDMVAAWIKYSPELSSILKITKSKSLISNIKTGSKYRALATDGGSIHGTNPYFAIIDEVHFLNSKKAREAVEAVKTGSGAQKQSLIVYISTAAATVDGTLLGELYMRGKNIVSGKFPQGNYGFYCWEADLDVGDQIDDPKVWEKCNPMLAEGLLEYSFLQGELDAAVQGGSPASFMRYFLNIWISVAGDPFINPYAWNQIYDSNAGLVEGEQVVAGFDGAKNGDSVCITVQSIETGHLEIFKIWERPQDADEKYFINRQDIENAFISLHNLYQVELIWADRFYYENDLVAWASDEGYDWNISIIPQTSIRMKEVAKDFQKDVFEKNITHAGQEPLTRHLQNTYAHEEKVFVKEAVRTTNRIDATVSAILCNGARNEILAEPEYEAPEVIFFS